MRFRKLVLSALGCLFGLTACLDGITPPMGSSFAGRLTQEDLSPLSLGCVEKEMDLHISFGEKGAFEFRADEGAIGFVGFCGELQGPAEYAGNMAEAKEADFGHYQVDVFFGDEPVRLDLWVSPTGNVMILGIISCGVKLAEVELERVEAIDIE